MLLNAQMVNVFARPVIVRNNNSTIEEKSNSYHSPFVKGGFLKFNLNNGADIGGAGHFYVGPGWG